jgi:hypothetical protein
VSGGRFVVNQLTSDRTLENLYARTGKFLLLYEGTGGGCPAYWPTITLEYSCRSAERRQVDQRDYDGGIFKTTSAGLREATKMVAQVTPGADLHRFFSNPMSAYKSLRLPKRRTAATTTSTTIPRGW